MSGVKLSLPSPLFLKKKKNFFRGVAYAAVSRNVLHIVSFIQVTNCVPSLVGLIHSSVNRVQRGLWPTATGFTSDFFFFFSYGQDRAWAGCVLDQLWRRLGPEPSGTVLKSPEFSVGESCMFVLLLPVWLDCSNCYESVLCLT